MQVGVGPVQVPLSIQNNLSDPLIYSWVDKCIICYAWECSGRVADSLKLQLRIINWGFPQYITNKKGREREKDKETQKKKRRNIYK